MSNVSISTSPKNAAIKHPRVSVVIPVRNDATRLAVCLDSLQRQRYPRDLWEIIVVDNGSTDDSRQVAESRWARVFSFPGLRVGALRNRGVEQATGEILAFVDSDHELPADWLDSAVDQLASEAAITMIGAPCIAPLQSSWVQRAWQWHRLRNAERKPVDWLGAGNMFLRRSDFLAIGGFREDLVAAEDVDLCLRLGKTGTIISDPRIVNIHHGEPRTLANFFWKEYWRGSSGVKAFIHQGMPLRELPSLLWPLYHLLAGLAVPLSFIEVWRTRSWMSLAIAIGILLLPSFLLAAKTSLQTKQFLGLPALWLLYLTFGFSRAAALFKS